MTRISDAYINLTKFCADSEVSYRQIARSLPVCFVLFLFFISLGGHCVCSIIAF